MTWWILPIYVFYVGGPDLWSADIEFVKKIRPNIYSPYIRLSDTPKRNLGYRWKLSVPSDDPNQFFILDISYKTFGGRTSRLGHDYRHLFQTAKFIASQDDAELPNKYEYIKTLRAQLSNHEQLLLYYNSLSDFGTPWLTNGYFTNDLMVKNLPLPLANFGVLPKDLLGEKNNKGDFIFEWDETYSN